MTTQGKLLFTSIRGPSLAPIFAALALLALASLVALAIAFWPREEAPFAEIPRGPVAEPATDSATAAPPDAGEEKARKPGGVWM